MKLFVLTLLAAAALPAAPLFTITPSGGISGRPGDTIGWGFSITADPTDWVTFISSFPLLETNPLLGIYTDLLGGAGGPGNGVLAPGSPAWNGQLAEYVIDPLASANDFNTGIIVVLYETFSADPVVCLGCRTGEGELFADFSVTVTNETPEPGTLGVAGLALLLLSFRRRRN
ncbi:MAG: PEP-CTERM sorting domain-containing protein [Acidobacteria bacterium]|nr:PEP-CTERM sorting domain-containing protein [Acidobacteriota bacterium]